MWFFGMDLLTRRDGGEETRRGKVGGREVGLEDLPDEILLSVLEHVQGGRSLLACEESSRLFRRVCSKYRSHLWRKVFHEEFHSVLQNYALYFADLERIQDYVLRSHVDEEISKHRVTPLTRAPEDWKEAYVWMVDFELKRNVMSEKEICDAEWILESVHGEAIFQSMSFPIASGQFTNDGEGNRLFRHSLSSDGMPWKWKVSRDGRQYIKVCDYPKLLVERCAEDGSWQLCNKHCRYKSLAKLPYRTAVRILDFMVVETTIGDLEFPLNTLVLYTTSTTDTPIISEIPAEGEQSGGSSGRAEPVPSVPEIEEHQTMPIFFSLLSHPSSLPT